MNITTVRWRTGHPATNTVVWVWWLNQTIRGVWQFIDAGHIIGESRGNGRQVALRFGGFDFDHMEHQFIGPRNQVVLKIAADYPQRSTQ